eukprot:CAMPEP_0198709718 /NCGR_PEP_ID=MMETSP1471-20131121/2042_1 /TAXON_ID=41880 /ORGANISM="Pycnococcus provasolii, Strain RCC733" /LENGTH=659 /DNA_ID=CAMNT_0044469173 /DNA_START=364 /DNA_END=2343 /DNA_ORIENTATION=+
MNPDPKQHLAAPGTGASTLPLESSASLVLAPPPSPSQRRQRRQVDDDELVVVVDAADVNNDDDAAAALAPPLAPPPSGAGGGGETTPAHHHHSSHPPPPQSSSSQQQQQQQQQQQKRKRRGTTDATDAEVVSATKGWLQEQLRLGPGQMIKHGPFVGCIVHRRFSPQVDHVSVGRVTHAKTIRPRCNDLLYRVCYLNEWIANGKTRKTEWLTAWQLMAIRDSPNESVHPPSFENVVLVPVGAHPVLKVLKDFEELESLGVAIDNRTHAAKLAEVAGHLDQLWSEARDIMKTSKDDVKSAGCPTRPWATTKPRRSGGTRPSQKTRKRQKKQHDSMAIERTLQDQLHDASHLMDVGPPPPPPPPPRLPPRFPGVPPPPHPLNSMADAFHSLLPKPQPPLVPSPVPRIKGSSSSSKYIGVVKTIRIRSKGDAAGAAATADEEETTPLAATAAGGGGKGAEADAVATTTTTCKEDKKKEMFRATVRLSGENVFLGTYADEDEAAHTREEFVVWFGLMEARFATAEKERGARSQGGLKVYNALNFENAIEDTLRSAAVHVKQLSLEDINFDGKASDEAAKKAAASYHKNLPWSRAAVEFAIRKGLTPTGALKPAAVERLGQPVDQIERPTKKHWKKADKPPPPPVSSYDTDTTPVPLAAAAAAS